MRDIEIILKRNMLPIHPKDFFFDAYGCIRYYTNLEATCRDDGKYVINRTVHIIPLSSISEIIIENDKRFEIECA